MARFRKALSAAVGIAALLEACSYPSGTTYTPNETGTIMRVEDASVASSREVKISGLDNKQAAGWGTAIGAAVAGTSAYGITKADNPAGVAITVVAAIVGGLAGLAAEEFRETRNGGEYILRDEAGKTVAVVQSLARARRSTRPEPTCR
jgi:outer membrane lipoprotein SlyB